MVDKLDVLNILFSYFVDIFYNFSSFLFNDFYIFPSPIGVSYGDLILTFVCFSLIFYLFLNIPKSNGGGKRGKSSKNDSSSSSSNSSYS